jgi:hypothetical protein
MRGMANSSNKSSTDTSDGRRGIVGAATQDLELTIEQAEEAAKRAAHKAAVALGLAHDEGPTEESPSDDRLESADENAAPPPAESKPKA